MAKAKARELRELAPDAVQGKINELEANLFNMKFQASMGKLENTSLIRVARRDIARAKTVLRLSTLGKASAPKQAAKPKATRKPSTAGKAK